MSDQELSSQPPRTNDTDLSAVTEQLGDTHLSDVPDNPEEANQSGSQIETIEFPELGPDWHFNIFLSDLASCLSVEDLKKIKCLFIDIIGKRVLEKIEIPEELFQKLRERRLITQDNLMLLQRCLCILQRKELIEKAIEYAATIGNCLYFYPAPEDCQVNGYRKVKYHVEGKDFTNCSRKDIEEIRMKTARLLFISPENVILVGVEPSSSMLITFLIPNMYAEVLESMIERKANFDDLYRSGIDIIIIGKHTHNIRGVEEVEIVESDQQAKLMNVYQQLKEKSELLEEAEVKLIEKEREIKHLESQLNKDLKNAVIVRTAERLFQNVVQDDARAVPSSSDTQGAFALFVEALDRAEKLEMDRRVIQNLLDANTQVVANRVRDCCAKQIDAMSREIQDLQGKTIPVEMELAKYRFFCQDNLDNIILDRFKKLLDSLKETQMVQEIYLNQNFLDILKKISRGLRFKERVKLMKMYDWKQDDKYKSLIDGDQTLILACLLCKEVEKTNASVDGLEFISKCLRDVGRTDLEKKFVVLCQRPQKRQQTPDVPSRPTSDEANLGRLDQITDVLKDVSMKVDRIDKTMQWAKDSTEKYPYNAKFGDPYCFSGYDSESSGVET